MKRAKRTRRTFDPKEKITAVLSVWTESRSATQVCRELSVSWALLDRWQNQAMEGMLKALSPAKKERKATLNHRLARLVEKKVSGQDKRLQERLKRIQDTGKELHQQTGR